MCFPYWSWRCLVGTSLSRRCEPAWLLPPQVCQLLKEVEDARSGYAMRAQEQEISLSEEGTPLSAEEVISKHLVSFRWAPSTDTGRRVDVTPPWP